MPEREPSGAGRKRAARAGPERSFPPRPGRRPGVRSGTGMADRPSATLGTLSGRETALSPITNTLADAAVQTASTTASHGALGGGMSIAALVGIGWLYHHTHRIANEMKSVGGGKIKHDPRRTLVLAFLLGALLSTGGGVVGAALAHGAGSVAGVLG